MRKWLIEIFQTSDVIPAMAGCGRIIASDLIGHGDSDKLPASDGPGRYGFEVAYVYLGGLLGAVGSKPEGAPGAARLGFIAGLSLGAIASTSGARHSLHEGPGDDTSQAGTTVRRKREASFRDSAHPRKRI